jgi:hypothetical protein
MRRHREKPIVGVGNLVLYEGDISLRLRAQGRAEIKNPDRLRLSDH